MLEGVFEFEGGKTVPKLIKRGFVINSIEGISQNSKHKNKQSVVNILQCTSECLGFLSACLDDFDKLDVELINNIRRTLLRHDDIDSEDTGDYKVYRLIGSGKFRKIPVRNEHNNGMEIVMYCHPAHVNKEMATFVDSVRTILKNGDIDPFVKCAWIQWAFLTIHPYEDGNGRVSRIISSIPLVKQHLPPVIVHKTNKGDYFKALHEAIETAIFYRLHIFLRIQCFRG